MKTKKGVGTIVFGILLLVVVISVFFILSRLSRPDGKEVIAVGFLGPMTGDNARYGELMGQAAELAVKEFNEAGGIEGKKIWLITEDSEGKISKGQAAAIKLIEKDQVSALIGPVFTSVGLTVAEHFNKAKTLVVTGSVTGADFTAKGPYVFRTIPSDNLQADVMARYINEVLKIKKLAVLYTKNQYSQSLTERLRDIYTSLGGEILIAESGKEGDKDFKTQISKIKAVNPEAVFLPNYVPENAQILKQIDALGLRVPVLSSDGFENPEIFSLVGELSNGVVFSGSPENNSSGQEDFSEYYYKEFGEYPDNFSKNVYDGAQIALQALKYAYNAETKDIDRDKVLEYMRTVKDFPGITGKITFADNGDVIKPIAIKKVESEAFRQIGLYKVVNGNLVEVASND